MQAASGTRYESFLEALDGWRAGDHADSSCHVDLEGTNGCLTGDGFYRLDLNGSPRIGTIVRAA